MNILITGGKGYIGQYLAQYFSNENVFVTTRTPRTALERKMILSDEKTIKGVCEGIDVVIHTASMDEREILKKPKEALLINAFGTRELYLDAAVCKVKKFLYLSTFHVYGTVEKMVTEESRTTPISDYALTHLFAEQYIRQLHASNTMQTSILRLTNGIGLPGNEVDKWYLAVNDFCRTIVREKQIVLKSNGLPRRDFIAIPDICSAIKFSLNLEEEFGVYNISSQKTVSIREIAFMVKEIYQKMTGEEAKLSLPEVSKEEVESIKDFTVSSQKLRKIGWEPKETLEKTIENILKHELEMRKKI